MIDDIDVAIWWVSAVSGSVFGATLLYWAIRWAYALNEIGKWWGRQ